MSNPPGQLVNEAPNEVRGHPLCLSGSEGQNQEAVTGKRSMRLMGMSPIVDDCPGII